MDPSTMLGPIDLLAPVIEYVVFVLIVANMGTRHLQHRRHKAQYERDASALTRHPIHLASNLLLILATFYLLSVDYHGGIILSVLVIGLVITDFFEFESRQVELRIGETLDVPKAAIFASGLTLLYAAYVAFFHVLEPAWRVVF